MRTGDIYLDAHRKADVSAMYMIRTRVRQCPAWTLDFAPK